MEKKKKHIFIAGHNGMVGSAIARILSKDTSVEIITRPRSLLDLTNQQMVLDFFKDNKIDEIYIAAALAGGIYANDNYPADFIYQNLIIQANIINAAFISNIKKILFLGSSCIYPKFSKQPISEEMLLTGPLELTNEPYAIAKIAGIKLCESFNRQYGDSHGVDYRSIMPTNLYGPRDNYHPENSHVIPSLIRRFHEAKVNKYSSVEIWGTGKPRREFLYVDDMADACVHIMNIDKKKYYKVVPERCSHINIGSGKDIAIIDLANIIKEVVGYKGEIKLNHSKPDGTPRKLLDNSRAYELGWRSKYDFLSGLEKTYIEFVKVFNK